MIAGSENAVVSLLLMYEKRSKPSLFQAPRWWWKVGQ